MEHLERVSINTPPHSEVCFFILSSDYYTYCKRRAYMRGNWWLQAQRSATELSHCLPIPLPSYPATQLSRYPVIPLPRYPATPLSRYPTIGMWRQWHKHYAVFWLTLVPTITMAWLTRRCVVLNIDGKQKDWERCREKLGSPHYSCDSLHMYGMYSKQ